jgi:predicted  nucleic acid-binding Zn-ribbon protein
MSGSARKRPIDEALQAYSTGDLQTFRNILIVLEQNGLTIDQLLKYTWYKTMARDTAILKTCPECGDDMNLFSVNHSPCAMVGGHYRSQWFCDNCGHSEYRRKSPIAVAHRVRRDTYKPIIKGTKGFDRQLLEWEINDFLRRPLDKPCPECGGKIYLYKVNTPPGKANIYGYKSMWFCELCGYQEYTKNSVKEEAIRLRRI